MSRDRIRFRWRLTMWARTLLLSVAVGALGGVAAAAIEYGLHRAVPELVGRFAASSSASLLVPELPLLFLPVVGGLISGVLVGILCPPDPLGGTEAVVRAYHHEGGRLPLVPPVLKALANVGVIAFGGSTGPEGPIAGLGAAIGSSLATADGLHARERRIFLLAGCAAGVSAMFRCPLGGALFATTILYREPENEDEALMPSIVSSVIAYATFMYFWGSGHPLLEGTEHLAFTRPLDLLAYMLLAALCAAAGAVFHGSFSFVEWLRLDRWIPRPVLPMVGALAVGAIALCVPQVMDAKYGFVQHALDGSLFTAQRTWPEWAAFFALVIGAKCLATALTVGTGNAGGALGPTVFVGGVVGAATGALLEMYAPGMFGPELRRALIPVGMAGMLAVTMRVPLAAAVMVTEITGSYGLIVPLIFVPVLAHILGRRFGLNHEQIGSPAESPAHAGRAIVNLLETLRVADLMDAKWPHVLAPDDLLGPALASLPRGTRPTFAVVGQGRLVGVIDVAHLLPESAGPGVTARSVMVPPVAPARPGDDLRSALGAFQRHPIQALPVVRGYRGRRFAGMLRREAIYRVLRERVAVQRAQFIEEYSEIVALDQEGQIEELLTGLPTERKLSVDRIAIPASAIGKSLRESGFRDAYRSVVIAIQTPSGELLSPPDPSRRFEAGDMLVVVHSDRSAASAEVGTPRAAGDSDAARAAVARDAPLVAVAGASGNAGRAIIRSLAERGFRIRALVRDEGRLGSVRALCDEVVHLDAAHRETIRGTLDGARYFVSALGKTRSRDAVARRAVDVDANARLFAEAKRVGVEGIVFVSAVGADERSPAPLARMKGEAERALVACGVPGLIVRPSSFFSDIWDLFLLARGGTFWLVGDGSARLTPVAPEDLGEVVAQAMADPATFAPGAVARVVSVGGPETFDIRQVVALCERVAGRPVRVRCIPRRLAGAAVALLRPFRGDVWETAKSLLVEVGGTHDAVAPNTGSRRLEDYLRERLDASREAPRPEAGVTPSPASAPRRSRAPAGDPR